MQERYIFIRVIKFLLITCLFFYTQAYSGERFLWSQIMPENQLWFRCVDESSDSCPYVNVDGEKIQMEVYHPKSDTFPQSCVLKFSLDFLPDSLVFDGVQYTTNFSKDAVKKIALIGDTGCRLGKLIKQDCEKNWPYKKILDAVMLHDPDLIIHVGDYVYREYGYDDQWAAWKDDFFIPSADALSSGKPWLMLRGNHESCTRAGFGWFSMLGRENTECSEYEPNYDFFLNGIRFVIIDSNKEENLIPSLRMIDGSILKHETWILTHRPLVFRNRANLLNGYINVFKSLHEKINKVISGHIHVVQFLDLEDGKQQIIVGNSGTLLSNYITSDGIDSKQQYGFSILEFKSDIPTISGYDLNNNLILTTEFDNSHSVESSK